MTASRRPDYVPHHTGSFPCIEVTVLPFSRQIKKPVVGKKTRIIQREEHIFIFLCFADLVCVESGETFQHLVVLRVGLLFHPPIATLPERGAPNISLSLVARYTSKRERERAVIFSFSIFTCYQFAGKGSVRRCEANAAKRRERQQTPSRDPCHHQIG